jgi:SAM-dependent methyltransferase
VSAQLYDDFWAACPDFTRYNPGARHRRRWIRGALARCRPAAVLDVGCGTGDLLRWLRASLPDVRTWTGLDSSSRTIAANASRDGGIVYRAVDIETTSLDQRFDAIVCTEVIEHLARPREALENVRAMLGPGGHLVLTCPTGKVHATERHFGHVAHPTPSGLRTMLDDAGFAIDRLENWGFPTYLALKFATNVRPEWALARFGSGAYDARAKAVSHGLYAANFLNLRTSRLGCQLLVVAHRKG